MDAFALESSLEEKRRIGIDGKFEWNLPFVRCHRCKQRFSCIYMEYPGVSRPSTELADRTDIGLDEFRALCHLIREKQPITVDLLPGAGAGALTAVSSGELADVSWLLPWRPLLHNNLVRFLEEAGFKFEYQTAEVRIHGRRTRTHAVLQMHPAYLLAEEDWKRLKLSRCDVCGGMRKGDFKPMPQDGYTLLHSQLPKGGLLCKPLEYPGMILISPIMVEKLASLKLKGALLRRVGEWI